MRVLTLIALMPPFLWTPCMQETIADSSKYGIRSTLSHHQQTYMASLAEYSLVKNSINLSLEILGKTQQISDSSLLAEPGAVKPSHQHQYNEAFTEKENPSLKDQNLKQDFLNQKKKIQNSFLIIGLAVTLISLGIFLMICRKNQEQKKEIEKQKNLVERLQRELHHRLKNNLSFIDFFITLAKKEFPEPAYQERLDDLQNRIDSMFEVHKQLYKKRDVTRVNARSYISALLQNIKKVYSRANIHLNQDIEDVDLIGNIAFPVGLIVNEFVTNSYKHAFPDDKMGTISIQLLEDKNHYFLKLSDTGKGLSQDFYIDHLNSFGMDTIKLLTEEYKGTFKLEGHNGVRMEIRFPKKTFQVTEGSYGSMFYKKRRPKYHLSSNF